MVNKELKEYIESEIFPEYVKNDNGHRIDHINYVIRRSFEFAKQFKNIDLNIVYTVASFHDIGHHIDKDNHEILSAKIFYENENMKKFFTDEERKIIKEAIEDHRASTKFEPRSDYGKIVSSADRNVDIASALRRTHAYLIKHYPDLTNEQMIERAYSHIKDKFGKKGYAKFYVEDKEYILFKKEVDRLLSDKVEFAKKYMEVNKL